MKPLYLYNQQKKDFYLRALCRNITSLPTHWCASTGKNRIFFVGGGGVCVCMRVHMCVHVPILLSTYCVLWGQMSSQAERNQKMFILNPSFLMTVPNSVKKWTFLTKKKLLTNHRKIIWEISGEKETFQEENFWFWCLVYPSLLYSLKVKIFQWINHQLYSNAKATCLLSKFNR